jgi:hypothetical protein
MPPDVQAQIVKLFNHLAGSLLTHAFTSQYLNILAILFEAPSIALAHANDSRFTPQIVEYMRYALILFQTDDN